MQHILLFALAILVASVGVVAELAEELEPFLVHFDSASGEIVVGEGAAGRFDELQSRVVQIRAGGDGLIACGLATQVSLTGKRNRLRNFEAVREVDLATADRRRADDRAGLRIVERGHLRIASGRGLRRGGHLRDRWIALKDLVDQRGFGEFGQRSKRIRVAIGFPTDGVAIPRIRSSSVVLPRHPWVICLSMSVALA